MITSNFFQEDLVRLVSKGNNYGKKQKLWKALLPCPRCKLATIATLAILTSPPRSFAKNQCYVETLCAYAYKQCVEPILDAVLTSEGYWLPITKNRIRLLCPLSRKKIRRLLGSTDDSDFCVMWSQREAILHWMHYSCWVFGCIIHYVYFKHFHIPSVPTLFFRASRRRSLSPHCTNFQKAGILVEDNCGLLLCETCKCRCQNSRLCRWRIHYLLNNTY